MRNSIKVYPDIIANKTAVSILVLLSPMPARVFVLSSFDIQVSCNDYITLHILKQIFKLDFIRNDRKLLLTFSDYKSSPINGFILKDNGRRQPIINFHLRQNYAVA